MVDVEGVPDSERAFYQAEFAGGAIVVSIGRSELGPEVQRVAAALAPGGSRLVLVVGDDRAGSVALDGQPLIDDESRASEGPSEPSGAGNGDGLGVVSDFVVSDFVVADFVVAEAEIDPLTMAELWLTVSDRPVVTVSTAAHHRAVVAARVAAGLRALKLVITDDHGGWGRPPRSFADVLTHAEAYRAQLADRQGGGVVEAIEVALAGGVTSVNLCKPGDLDRELFTFDGTGTLFTSGGYVALTSLGIADLAAVEELVEAGTADGVLRPRSRLEIAHLATHGLGAKVVGSGHLAGVVGLVTEPYRAERVGEVAALYTVSRFSGSGAGGLLVEGLIERARVLGLRSLFAVTVAQPAADLFVRKGFEAVPPTRLPAAKWDGYDRSRLAEVQAFWLDLNDPEF